MLWTPQLDAEITRLIRVDGLSRREVSIKLGIRENAVHGRYWRIRHPAPGSAKDKLRRILYGLELVLIGERVAVAADLVRCNPSPIYARLKKNPEMTTAEMRKRRRSVGASLRSRTRAPEWFYQEMRL